MDPYIQSVRVLLYIPTTPGVIIMDNFKGQVTDKVISLLEKCHLHVCLLPVNTTDLLQSMDVLKHGHFHRQMIGVICHPGGNS